MEVLFRVGVSSLGEAVIHSGNECLIEWRGLKSLPISSKLFWKEGEIR